MPQRVSIKTQDLINIIDTYAQNISGRGLHLMKTWEEYHTIRSFSEFRSLEEAFSTAANALQDCIDILKDWRV